MAGCGYGFVLETLFLRTTASMGFPMSHSSLNFEPLNPKTCTLDLILQPWSLDPTPQITDPKLQTPSPKPDPPKQVVWKRMKRDEVAIAALSLEVPLPPRV